MENWLNKTLGTVLPIGIIGFGAYFLFKNWNPFKNLGNNINNALEKGQQNTINESLDRMRNQQDITENKQITQERIFYGHYGLTTPEAIRQGKIEAFPPNKKLNERLKADSPITTSEALNMVNKAINEGISYDNPKSLNNKVKSNETAFEKRVREQASKTMSERIIWGPNDTILRREKLRSEKVYS